MDIVGSRTLATALEDKVRRFPAYVFVIAEDSARWTWQEFDRDVNRAANLLLARGLKPGGKFNLHLGNCPEFLLFWMAAAKTGTVMVPTNPSPLRTRWRTSSTTPKRDCRSPSPRTLRLVTQFSSAVPASPMSWSAGRSPPSSAQCPTPHPRSTSPRATRSPCSTPQARRRSRRGCSSPTRITSTAARPW